MNFIKSPFFTVLFFTIIACKNDKVETNTEPVPKTISTFYFIRHAEKDTYDPTNTNPELSQEGLGRAIFWAKVFETIDLDEIYSTDFERTKMTAAPTSIQKDITITYYDYDNIDATQFLTDNLGKKVLVVGHGDTTPEFINKILGEEKYPQMYDDDNSSLYTVTIIGDTATSSILNIDIGTD